jgi:two-component system, LuxR family, response regulator FixJ
MLWADPKGASVRSGEASVWVIDDDAGMRTSLMALLSSAGWAAHAFGSAQDFLDAAPRWTTGRACVVTDVRMPGIDGLALLAHLRTLHCAQPVIVMTGHGDVAMAVQAMKAGAFDFVEKPFSDHLLLAAIGAAIAAQEAKPADPVDPRFALAAEQVAALTPREREVLELLAEGKPNKIIAHELGLSPRTVEIHRARMLDHLKVASLAEALRIAILADLANIDGG